MGGETIVRNLTSYNFKVNGYQVLRRSSKSRSSAAHCGGDDKVVVEIQSNGPNDPTYSKILQLEKKNGKEDLKQIRPRMRHPFRWSAPTMSDDNTYYLFTGTGWVHVHIGNRSSKSPLSDDGNNHVLITYTSWPNYAPQRGIELKV